MAYGIHILSECGIQTEGVEAALQKTSITGIKFTDRMKSGFDGLAATLGMSSKALLGWIGGITAAVTIFTLVSRYIEKTKQHLLDCVNAADAASESWNTQNATLESQIARIQELDAKLQLGNMTEEESYAVKSELYSIQQDLVAAYGDQANAIDLVNGKLSQEIEKVKALTAAEAQRQWNENYEGNQEAAKQMEEERTFDLGSHIVMRDSAVDKALKSILNKYKVYELQKSLFQDSLNDIEHSISILERESGNDQQIINLYLDTEYASGLTGRARNHFTSSQKRPDAPLAI